MADAISKIIDNEKLLTELSVSAFKYASRERTWSKTIGKTIELYKGLL
jgi:glycosyltransferase involved in cell wall biosynthesis